MLYIVWFTSNKFYITIFKVIFFGFFFFFKENDMLDLKTIRRKKETTALNVYMKTYSFQKR